MVDSGSRDGTVEIARAAGAAVIEIPAESFTYGGSLNTGSAQARAPLIVALSAHAFPPDEHWLERLRRPFSDERVACACGYPKGPDGDPLTGRVVQDLDMARANPFWGYSNSSGAFRAELWRERPFREDMPGTEDKEWAWHWLQQGRGGGRRPDLRHRALAPRRGATSRARTRPQRVGGLRGLPRPRAVRRARARARVVERPRRLPVAPAGAHRLAAGRPAGREVARALQPRRDNPDGMGVLRAATRRLASRRSRGGSKRGRSSPTGASAGPPTVRSSSATRTTPGASPTASTCRSSSMTASACSTSAADRVARSSGPSVRPSA